MSTEAVQRNSIPFRDTQISWTDDLPVCKNSSVGYSTNKIYREDGYRQEHPFEDRSFHCKYDNNTFLYAVFDGHKGTKVAAFAMQRIAAEILLGKLNGKTTDEEVKEVLRQAFITVECGYNDSIRDLLAERTSLQCDIPNSLNSYEAYKQVPDVVNKLNALNCELSTGTSAVIVLIYNNKLYVANVGDSRALLCKTDSNHVLKVEQLSVDHNLRNEDELLRLSHLGLDIKSIRQGTHLGNQENTRCLGNYLVKGGYKEFEELSLASAEPIIAKPEIYGGIEMNESCQFLLLMSRGLYKSLEEATGIVQINKELVLQVVEQFRVQSTLNGVAQAVVDKIVRIHHDANMNNLQSTNGKRDDITLLVRNFNFPLPNAFKSSTTPLMDFNTEITKSSSYGLPEEATSTTDEISMHTCDASKLAEKKNARIKAYVDFSEYYTNLEKKRKEGTLPAGIKF